MLPRKVKISPRLPRTQMRKVVTVKIAIVKIWNLRPNQMDMVIANSPRETIVKRTKIIAEGETMDETEGKKHHQETLTTESLLRPTKMN